MIRTRKFTFDIIGHRTKSLRTTNYAQTHHRRLESVFSIDERGQRTHHTALWPRFDSDTKQECNRGAFLHKHYDTEPRQKKSICSITTTQQETS